MKDLPTFEEKKTQEESHQHHDRQNTYWQQEIQDKCDHKWQPVSLANLPGQNFPDLVKACCYCVCLKCCSHTYYEVAWAGYMMTGPDLLEDEMKYPEKQEE